MATRKIRPERYIPLDKAHRDACSEYSVTSHKKLDKPKCSKGSTAMADEAQKAATDKVHMTTHHQHKQETNAMPLSEFVVQHAKNLPIRVQVQSGYYGHNNEFTISAGEILNIYFKKVTTTFTAQAFNTNYSIPINSDLQFSILHAETSQEATKQFVYYSVADLMEANSYPKVVCCIEDRTQEGLVKENEILILAADQESSDYLKVFSTLTNTEKLLPRDLQITTSTHPNLVPVYLADLIYAVSNLFPCSAIAANSPHIPASLQQVVTLVGTSALSTLLCSSEGSSQLFDIPLDIPGVEVIPLPTLCKTDREELYSRTREIIQNFNPGNVHTINDSASTLDSEVQSFLYSNIRSGFETIGVSLSGSSFITSVLLNCKLAPQLKENINSTVQTQNCSQTCSVLIPTQNTPPPLLPRKKSSISLPDVDEISPSYDTHATVFSVSKSFSTPKSCHGVAQTTKKASCLSLQNFAKMYSKKVPLSIHIQNGHHHANNIQVSTGDVLVVQYIIDQDVILFKDISNCYYTLPLTAASQFAISCTSSAKQVEFETIEDIIKAVELPRVVCARRSFQCSQSKSSVMENEILIIQEINKIKNVIKAYSITFSTKKYLSSKCKGHFTSAPDFTKLSVLTMHNHLFDLLPDKMIIFIQKQELPTYLDSQEVTVIGYYSENSIIVSAVNSKIQHFSIPLTAQMEVLVTSFSEYSTSISNQNPVEKKTLSNDADAPSSMTPLKGSFFQLNNTVSLPLRPKHKQHSYESVDIENNNHVPIFNKSCSSLDSIPPLTHISILTLHPTQSDGNVEETDYTYVDCQYKAPMTPIPTQPITSQSTLSTTEIPNGNIHEVENEKIKRNRSFVASLKEEQVLAILQGMGLQAYIDKFHQEKITGDIFSNLDDEILERELGVQSRLHRMRLLKVAKGDTDVTQFM